MFNWKFWKKPKTTKIQIIEVHVVSHAKPVACPCKEKKVATKKPAKKTAKKK